MLHRLVSRWLGLLLALVAATAAQAQQNGVAVLSVAGDGMTIVHAVPSVGSHLDRNHREFVPVAANTLDRMLLVQVHDALASQALMKARWQPLMLAASGTLRQIQAEALGGKATTAELVDNARAAVAAALAGKELPHHLLLVTKHRAEARLKVTDGHIGVGRLDGLGFYIDRTTRLKHTESRRVGDGYVAPFLHLKLVLARMADGRVLGEERILTGAAVPTALNDAAIHPWDALDADGKSRLLAGLFQEALAAKLPALMARAGG